jgi:ubiquinone/menaquinone biosynthesis C-methylase UbiE
MLPPNPQAKPGIIYRLLTWFLRWFFQLLYHQLAWTYDFIAWTVSLGQWKHWIQAVIPYLNNPMLLEIGHGPGHLQAALIQEGFHTIGLDQSPQMCRRASRRLRKIHLRSNLVNARSQQIPFPSDSIPQIVSTFPSEYINDPQSLQELYRVLTPGGSMIILLFAWITGKNILERSMAWLFRVTGETPAWNDQFLVPARGIGFLAYSEITTLPRSRLLLIRLQKPVDDHQYTTQGNELPR